MKRLFYSLGSLISVLTGTEKQPSDGLYRGLPAALVIQEFVVTQVCSVHGGKKKIKTVCTHSGSSYHPEAMK